MKYYKVEETFIDETTGKTLKCIKGIDCMKCIASFCHSLACTPTERSKHSAIFEDVIFIDASIASDQTELTQHLLLNNGWIKIDNDNVFELDKIKIFCADGFTCGLQSKSNDLIGEPFTTVGELKTIAKALYKIELEFKYHEPR